MYAAVVLNLHSLHKFLLAVFRNSQLTMRSKHLARFNSMCKMFVLMLIVYLHNTRYFLHIICTRLVVDLVVCRSTGVVHYSSDELHFSSLLHCSIKLS